MRFFIFCLMKSYQQSRCYAAFFISKIEFEYENFHSYCQSMIYTLEKNHIYYLALSGYRIKTFWHNIHIIKSTYITPTYSSLFPIN